MATQINFQLKTFLNKIIYYILDQLRGLVFGILVQEIVNGIIPLEWLSSKSWTKAWASLRSELWLKFKIGL